MLSLCNDNNTDDDDPREQSESDDVAAEEEIDVNHSIIPRVVSRKSSSGYFGYPCAAVMRSTRIVEGEKRSNCPRKVAWSLSRSS